MNISSKIQSTTDNPIPTRTRNTRPHNIDQLPPIVEFFQFNDLRDEWVNESMECILSCHRSRMYCAISMSG